MRLQTLATNDHRSYQISSEKIARELGFRVRHTIEEAVQGLVAAFERGDVPNAMTDPRYRNVAMLRQVGLK